MTAIEGVGANYDRSMMLEARRRTRQAIQDIAARIEVGMTEAAALEVARDVLKKGELLRGWHGHYVRIGPDTLKPFGAPSAPDLVLGANDIFFIDIGPVWQKWEGDGGETFVTGGDPDMLAAQRDVHVLFDRVQHVWRTQRLTGAALYAFATEEAQRLGWVLNLDLNGHRLADFPHSAIHKGALADFDQTPGSDLWVLEIHIRHPVRPFGAFFEDTLFESEPAG